MIDETLREMALKYALLPSFGEESDQLWYEMVSGFGEVDAKIATEEMEQIVKILCPQPFTTIQWYTGIAIKDPSNPIFKGKFNEP